MGVAHLGERPMTPSQGRFVWFELMTSDMVAARAFYADVVGWGMRDASVPGAPYTLLTVGGTSVCGIMGLSGAARRAGVQPSWIGYVGAGDIDAATDRAVRLGGTLHIPPAEIPGVSRFSVVSDPQAARLGLFKWLMPRPDVVDPASRPGHVGWSELLAAERRGALDFYRELFGWDDAKDEAAESAGEYSVFAMDRQPIGGVLTKPEFVPAPFWLHYVVVPDIAAAAARVAAGGGRILNGPVEGPGDTWILHAMDPQGALFALMGRGYARTVTATWRSDWERRPTGGKVSITRVGSVPGDAPGTLDEPPDRPRGRRA
ncbi:Glyoxalase/bleomycin resistance protein/dioxygenase [Methylobacterium sp. 4-46]|uniref:VOC family protein n=1 Tax=unclassified Methylobacterium TaxID=2615210 RepID=UPI000165C66E|nr:MULTISPECIES: VOC family protein [Methylobacterium]ACA18331.1 Glyoxalase/bleomycin resistance protein/dioxygenase [Methylobacterium sp. 4-46]WFT77629.1 VOC family protein [Methylobacterium nodulans]